jgi:hypothetical protein
VFSVYIPRKRRSSFSPSPSAPPPQLRPAPATESEKATSADQSWQPPLPAYVRNGVKPSRSRTAVAVFDEMHHRFRHSKVVRRGTAPDVGGPPAGHPRPRVTAAAPPLRTAPGCAAAHIHLRSPPPLPLLVLSDFSFASFCANGTRDPDGRVPPRPAAGEGDGRLAASAAWAMGSFEGWLVGVKLNKGCYFGDLRCFLMNVFSRDVVRLPPPSTAARPAADAYSRSLPIGNGSGDWCGELRDQLQAVRDVILQSAR